MGETLIKKVTEATGLPEEIMNDELNRLLARAGVEPEALTLDDLRSVLADYVQEVLLELKQSGDLKLDETDDVGFETPEIAP